ncbi:MAG: YfhO family protein [Clostridia bacterium]|nr:YfhO family protein [Clostridia bacterium]
MHNDLTAETERCCTEINDMPARRRWSPDAKALFWCFAAPFFAMILIYCCLMVWPAGKNSVLVLDLNAQYIYYFEQLRDILTGDGSLLYSFERALGGEFMGIFAYYLSSPFSLLVALFPKENITEAMYLILVLKTGCCGLAFGYFLTKTRELSPAARVMFSSMYALSAYVVVMQHNVMWIDNVIAFPLLLCGIDALIRERKFKLYVFALVYAVFSNFYIGYMTCLFVLIWFFVRYFMLSVRERNPYAENAHFFKSLLCIGAASLTAIMISAVILLPTVYSLSFGKLEFSEPNYTPKQMFEFADLLTKAFFGSYDTVRPAGMPFIYCGTLSLILAPLYFFAEKIPTRKKVGMAVMMLVLIVSFNFSIADIIWHGMQRPNWLNARFAYMFVGLEVIMAADAFRHLAEIGRKTVLASAVFWCALLVILAKIGYDNLPDFMAVWAGILCFVLLAAVLPSVIREAQQSDHRKRASFLLCGIVLAEAVGNGVVCLYQLDDDVSYSNRNSYRQMIDTYSEAVDVIKEAQPGDAFFRAEKLVHRKKNDNFALDLRGLSNSTSTLNARAVAMLQQFGYASMSHWSMYAGSTPVTDALFDIRYIITDETDDRGIPEYITTMYDKIGGTDSRLDVYENPSALSIAYAVNEKILAYDQPAEEEDGVDNYTDPFNYMNKLLSAMTGEEIEVWERISVDKTEEQGVEMLFVTGHRGYEDDGTLTPKLTWTFEAENENRIFAYFPSKYPRDAKLKCNGESLGDYFDGQDFSLRELGRFEEGEEITVSLYLEEEEIYIRSGCSYFWSFDEDAFLAAMELLRDGTMDSHSDRDDHLYGTITVPEGDSVIFTTIPYDEGWEVRVDGQTAETTAVLNETFLAFSAAPGEHELTFTYKPDCVRYGLILTAAGLVVFIAACVIEHIYRKKHPLPYAVFVWEDDAIIPDADVYPEREKADVKTYVQEPDRMDEQFSDNEETDHD